MEEKIYWRNLNTLEKKEDSMCHLIRSMDLFSHWLMFSDLMVFSLEFLNQKQELKYPLQKTLIVKERRDKLREWKQYKRKKQKLKIKGKIKDF